MIPFARELLNLGAKVVIAAITLPSINDITAAELDILLQKIDDELFKAKYESGVLQCVASGNGTCVIDLRKLSEVRMYL